MNDVPCWNLDSVYTSFDAPEYKRDIERLKEKIACFSMAVETQKNTVLSKTSLPALLRAFEEAGDYAENLSSYSQAVYTTDTQNQRALSEINAVDAAKLPLNAAVVAFRNLLARQDKTINKLLETEPELREYGFFLNESIKKAAFQMPEEMEDLANDLSRSGGDAWSRLHDALSSGAGAAWDKNETKTAVELREFAHNPDRSIREKAYKAEILAWKSVETPMAAAINGVKGWTLTVDKRRGWKNPLSKSAFQSRIGEKTLQTLISALESSLPMFRRYLKAKASFLGIEKCAFFDLFAPLGCEAKKWSWDEATTFVADRFAEFDIQMADFARRAFSANWVDAKVHSGKIGGAYCTDFPLAKESRILCNFTGSFDSVTTIAHETGHAWHHEIIKDMPRTLAAYPMTLAETASLFAETLIFEGALKTADSSGKIALIERNISDCAQVIVDILSRYYFEKALFDRRETHELSVEELCALMIDAQKKTYGDALDQNLLHPYMWAVKVHYYSPSLAFYNYPYAFGQLFALALYARFQNEGASFTRRYRELLAMTGRASAEDVAHNAGFDIESDGFWQTGLSVIENRITGFEKSAALK